MRPFTRFVSRKLLNATAGFAAFAATLGGFALVHGLPTAAAATDQARPSASARPVSTTPAASSADGRTAPDPAGRARLRADLRAAIIQNALAGEYGPDVQKAAERLEALHHPSA